MHMHAFALQGEKSTSDHWSWSDRQMSHLTGYWESNPSFLREQYMLFTAKPVLHAKTYLCIWLFAYLYVCAPSVSLSPIPAGVSYLLFPKPQLSLIWTFLPYRLFREHSCQARFGSVSSEWHFRLCRNSYFSCTAWAATSLCLVLTATGSYI